MKKNFFILCLLFISIFWSCKNNPKSSPDYMILDDIVYIDQFPQVYNLTNGVSLDLGIIGILSFSIQDSLLIVTTKDDNGMWSFFSLPEYNFKGKYLIQGRGPNEFLRPPWVEDQYFFSKQGELFSIIYEYSTGKSYRINISKTLQNNQLSISETDYSLQPFSSNFSIIDTTTFFYKEINENQTQRIRYLLKNGEKNSSRNLEKLNKALIKQGEDINILATHVGISPDKSRIVETGIHLNQINLYSIDDSFGKTICFGKKVDNISRIQQIDRWDRMYNYMNTNVYPEFFTAIYLNDTDGNNQQGLAKNPVIQFFDWNGNPLAEVNIDKAITTCVIDFIHKNLYTMNYQTEEMYKYDFKEVLEKLFH